MKRGLPFFDNITRLVTSLRDISVEQLRAHRNDLPELVYRRCEFIVMENERVVQSVQLLRQGQLAAFGELMFEAHDGLSKLYEVSCPESDFLVQFAQLFGGICGSRQMGGGFGGCTINIIPNAGVSEFSDHIQKEYEKRQLGSDRKSMSTR